MRNKRARPCFGWSALALTSLLLTVPEAHPAGPYFEPLRNGRFASFDNQSAYRIRVYVKGLFAQYEKQCPKEAPDFRVPWDLVAYGVKPANSVWGVGGSIFSVELSARDAAFFAVANAETDIAAVGSCSAAAHQDWIIQGKKMLSDPRIAAPLSGLAKACEAAGQASHDCACFEVAYDMQASPAQRRRLLDAKTLLQGFQQTLDDADFATRVAIRCSSTPNFFAAVLVEQPPAHASQPDDAHRLREGEYHIKAFNDPYRRIHGTYTITRTSNWRYEFKFQGVGGKHIGYLSSDGTEVTLYVGKPSPRKFRVMDDGTLRTLDGDDRFDLVHASARAPTPTGPRMPVPTPGKTKADPRQCARLEADIERARTNPRAASTLAILKQRHADWCASQ